MTLIMENRSNSTLFTYSVTFSNSTATGSLSRQAVLGLVFETARKAPLSWYSRKAFVVEGWEWG